MSALRRKLDNIFNKKEDIRLSIIGKGGTLPPSAPLSAYSLEIDGLSGNPSFWNLKDMSNNLLDTGSIPSGGTMDIIAPNANYIVKYDDGALIEGGAIVAGASKEITVQSCKTGWIPPKDWKYEEAEQLITDNENGFVCQIAVYPNTFTFFPFMSHFAGTGSVDFGDGTGAHVVATGVKVEGLIEYDNIPSSITSLGYKVCTVLFKATGDMSHIMFNQYHSLEIAGGEWQINAFAIKARSTAGACYPTFGRLNKLQILDIETMKLDYVNSLFYGMKLKKLLFELTPNATTAMVGAFQNSCFDGFDWNSLDYSTLNNITSAWGFATGSGVYALDIDIKNSNSINQAFYVCNLFGSVKLRNTGNVLSMDEAIRASGSIKSFEMDDCSKITSTTNFTWTDNYYKGLMHLILPGLPVGIYIAGQPMSATALNNFFTELGTANGEQFITITGCTGAGTCDQTIATAKGFTIVN